jgi:hypothetical protein
MKRIFFFLTIAVFLAACSDNDSFTTSPSARLTFSVDTVKMDTIFSSVGSATYSFWAYNYAGDGIRISNVRLKKGNQTGFRVNVDGSYLDNSLGSVASDLEVRKGDSIRVFVELTAPVGKDQLARLVTDNLVFALESGVEQQVVLQAFAWDAEMWHDKVFTASTLISSSRPIIVYGSVKIEKDVTLTIRNTQLFFHDKAGMDVYGKLHTDSVVMRGDRLDHMFDYLPYDRVSGQWGGIHFYDMSADNQLHLTEIRNATNAIVCDSARLGNDNQRLYMDSCIVHNSKGVALELHNAYVGLKDCQITNSGGDCILAYGGAVLLDGCTLAQFYPFSANRGVAMRFFNARNGFAYPLETLSMKNSILTGYANDELMGTQTDEQAAFNYLFENCLLRTPEVKDDTLHFKSIIWENPKDEIQGKKHFRLIDETNLKYDFHLDSLSTAKGLGCYR